ncbi:SGNH hydrolase-type esterase domain-containing protein [Fomitopsis serialis]|uniref:SGNH hydrolase-type esterase domain-containing protein n=1 Tax=Fomitopsis serialis TaxID=139415 RepID=UPI0020086238|nr:SGNH hydrolase-type esterase domain-containing protein [Neoantrodia serialis]KAH9915901.1 SGNH hydrolase-type esterase domain-containing protein [Neoantrodia serialis]
MIACSVSACSEGGGDSSTNENQVKTYNCGPSQEVVLVDEDTPTARPVPVKITLTLVDWASVFELESIVVDNEDSVQALPNVPSRSVRVLAIGDSITAGYSDGSQPIPLGCLSAYAHIAKGQIYAKTGIEIELELVAFPGVTLVAPTPEEADEGAGQGMIDRFFHTSQWSDEPAALDEQPSIIVIALGTNDDAQDVSPDQFVSTMRAFVDRLLQVYRTSVKHICVLHPFPDFTEDSDPETTESAEQVPITRDLSSTLASLRSNAGQGVEFHEWDIGGDLRREHTMDGLHPTISGHRILGDALAQQLAQLVSFATASTYT